MEDRSGVSIVQKKYTIGFDQTDQMIGDKETNGSMVGSNNDSNISGSSNVVYLLLTEDVI